MKALGRSFSLFAVMITAGCAQTMSSSEVELDVSEQKADKIQYINSLIMKKVDNEGGECGLFREHPKKYHCIFPNSTLSVNFGFLRKDKELSNPSYYIFINSNYIHFLPPKRKAVINGSYVLKTHTDLESWLLERIPSDIIAKKIRIYHGYDTTMEL